MKAKQSIPLLGLLVVIFGLGGCGDDDPLDDQPPGSFGETTSVVVVVNPKINQGSTTSVVPGTKREGIKIEPGDDDPVTTDSTGLAVADDLPTGAVALKFDKGTVNLTVVAAKELYDVVVAYTDSGVQEIVPVVRYPIGGNVKVVKAGGSISEAALEDQAIVLLEPGNYPGNFELTSEGVLIFGAWSPTEGQLSTIDGNVSVRGGGNRMRGVRVNGLITCHANTFSAAFSEFTSADITGNGVSLIRNKFTSAQVTVPSSSAVLVDNAGVP